MKILYVKCNSERSKEYQLKTIVYEENGHRFVKKEALCSEAIPHLKKMKESYNQLSSAILNPKIKLAQIIGESSNSLTFEYIQGISLEKRFSDAMNAGASEVENILNEYKDLLEQGFKTTIFDSKSMVTEVFKHISGDTDFSYFDGARCFEDVSNLDLIFSNIIYTENDIYIIDYEWVYTLNAPIQYIVFRATYFSNLLMKHMNDNFTGNIVVGENGFFKKQVQYLKKSHTIEEYLQLKDQQIEQLNERVQFLRLKNRGKRMLKKIIPSRIWNILKYLKDHPRIISKGFKILKTKGIKTFLQKIVNFKNTPISILNYTYVAPILTEIIKKEISSFKETPLISIVMPVYNVDPKWLDLAIKSIENQWYEKWELCIADDKSTNQATIDYLKNIHNKKIKIKFLETNLNISGSSNEALLLASGKYIALMDNDDEITPDALYEIVKTINETGAEFIYSDEDKLEMNGKFSDAFFKPDYSPDLMLSQNYICHFTCMLKKHAIDVGGFHIGFEGSQDHDLFLRVLEKTDKIHHITKILYHWRKIPGSTAYMMSEKNYAWEAGRKAVEEALKRRRIQGKSELGYWPGSYIVKRDIITTPLVSIIIPFKDQYALLQSCLDSIINKSTYKNYEIIGISNNSKEEETFQLMHKYSNLHKQIKFYEYNIPFNYSQINNYAVENYARGEHLIFLNNDIEIISENWIEVMLEHSQREEVGAVGARLYYADNTIQHAGIIMGLGGIANHSHRGVSRYAHGYFSRPYMIQNVSAVTAACMMIKKSLFVDCHGFDEQHLEVAFNDVDLCLRILEKGLLNVYTPLCEAYHYESKSRGYDNTKEKLQRLSIESEYINKRHNKILENGDPYYNVNLSLEREDFSLK